MPSLIASTERHDSDMDEATEPYDDDRTETDSTVSVSASSTGSFEESGVTNFEDAEVCHSLPFSPTLSTSSDKTLLYDVSDNEDAVHEFFTNPTIEKRKVCPYISTKC